MYFVRSLLKSNRLLTSCCNNTKLENPGPALPHYLRYFLFASCLFVCVLLFYLRFAFLFSFCFFICVLPIHLRFQLYYSLFSFFNLCSLLLFVFSFFSICIFFFYLCFLFCFSLTLLGLRTNQTLESQVMNQNSNLINTT